MDSITGNRKLHVDNDDKTRWLRPNARTFDNTDRKYKARGENSVALKDVTLMERASSLFLAQIKQLRVEQKERKQKREREKEKKRNRLDPARL